MLAFPTCSITYLLVTNVRFWRQAVIRLTTSTDHLYLAIWYWKCLVVHHEHKESYGAPAPHWLWPFVVVKQCRTDTRMANLQVEDLIYMQHANVMNLPENYNMKYCTLVYP